MKLQFLRQPTKPSVLKKEKTPNLQKQKLEKGKEKEKPFPLIIITNPWGNQNSDLIAYA